MQLTLIHQTPGDRRLPPGTTVWRTCLREIAFVRDATSLVSDHKVLTDQVAYALLVEVVCGLRSPLAGETEVQAQFKAFLASLDPAADRDLLRLGQRVLTDARLIRRTHLQGVGVDAYGRLAARAVPAGRRVALVGTGALATEVLASLSDRHQVDQWGRKPQPQRARYHLLSTAAARPVHATEAASLVVAAPALRPDLEAVAGCYAGLMEVVDLRANNDATPVAAAGCRLITLDDLFGHAGSCGPDAARVAAARHDILILAGAFAGRENLRPFGWDDLCA